MKKITVKNEKELEELFSQRVENLEIYLDEKKYFLSSPLVLTGNNISIIGNGSQLLGAKQIKGGFVPTEKENVYKRKIDALPFARLFSTSGELKNACYPCDDADTVCGTWDISKNAMKIDKKYTEYLERNARITMNFEWVQFMDRCYSFVVEEDAAYISFSQEILKRINTFSTYLLTNKKFYIYFTTDKELLSFNNAWMFEEKEKTLYIRYEDDNINDQTFYIPFLENVLTVENSKNINIKDLDFSITNWSYPIANSMVGAQATIHTVLTDGKLVAKRPPAMVHIKKSDNVSFENCELSFSGESAFDVSPYSHNVSFENGKVFSSGGNGIIIGFFRENEVRGPENRKSYIPKEKDEIVSNVYIRNCEIIRSGEFDKQGSGIVAGHCRDLYIEDNTVFYTGYSGIACGWGWLTNEPSFITNLQINRNKITDYLMSALTDGAGIYLLGGQSGEIRSSVKENYIKGSDSYAILYLDEGTSYVDAERNVLIGEAFMGSLFCHDLWSKLQSLHLNGNYATKNSWKIRGAQLPEGPSPSPDERDIICDGLIVFDESDIKDEDLLKIINNAGKKN